MLRNAELLDRQERGLHAKRARGAAARSSDWRAWPRPRRPIPCPTAPQRKLEICPCAMATGPKLLLLDEPAAGMNPIGDPGPAADCIRTIRDLLRRRHPAHRARHEPGDGRLPAHPRARLRTRHRRRAPRSRSPTTPQVVAAYLGAAGRDHDSDGAQARKRGSLMLEVKNLSVSYGAIHALKDVSIRPSHAGEIVSLIGANGAGKTTTLHTIIRPGPRPEGRNPPSVMYNGVDPARGGPRRSGRIRGPRHGARARKGRGASSPRITVLERTWRWARSRPQGPVGPQLGEDLERGLRPPSPGSRSAAASRPARLSGGEQQMLAMGLRADEPAPRLLLMDEPSMGLSPSLVGGDLLHHHASMQPSRASRCCWSSRTPSMALSIADRAYVLETGRITMEVTPRNCSITSRCARRIWAPDSCRIRLVGLDASKPTGLFLYPMEYSPVVFPPFGAPSSHALQ